MEHLQKNAFHLVLEMEKLLMNAQLLAKMVLNSKDTMLKMPILLKIIILRIHSMTLFH